MYVWDGILVDVTERIAAQEAIRTSEARVQEADRMELVGRLAGGVAHDFNNLLTIIIGFADMMLSDLPLPEIRGAAEQIQRAATRASSLTHQLLAVGRRLIMQPEAVALNDVITSTDQLVRRTLGEAIDVRLVLGEGLSPVLVDAHQIERVLLNLALNARDAMPDGGTLTLSTGTTEVSAVGAEQRRVAAGQYVHVAVSDTGTGMSDDVRSHLFEPFFTTKPIGRGTGLGLAAVEGIVRQSGGFIAVDTVRGAGTTFTVCLPATDVTPMAANAAPLSRPRGSERILLVEDDAAVRRLTETVLRRQGYSVVTADSGKSALAEVGGEPDDFDLVVTDVVMMGMAGPELVERLRRLRPTLRALFVSGHSDDAVLRAGIADGRADFLQKPYTPAALATRVRAILDA
jgi:nitrogen-specific signal transduction histidine kinase/CheY-like chemotaxis protein